VEFFEGNILVLSKKQSELKRKLDYHYKYFDFSQISPDPLEFPHRYTNYHDIEISAFISSIFAYGNVKQIINTLEKIHKLMGHEPYKFVMRFNYERDIDKFREIKHRFYTNADIAALFYYLNKIYTNYGSLKYSFLLYYFEKDPDLKSAISFFSKHFIEIISGRGDISHGIKFMLPDPLKGSACKRMNLFLRWMVRIDDLDFGLWHDVSPDQLVIPVDTHVAEICKRLKLTRRKNVSWLMAEEITKKLKQFDPSDPVKYDFAICHIGMRKMSF
jgi:uncharacterized protein (TIGR02757 family)